MLYAAHKYHGVDYDYDGVHTALEEATIKEVEANFYRRLAEEGQDDYTALDDFFLVETFSVRVTASELFEFKITADGFGLTSGDLFYDNFQTNQVLEMVKEIPVFTAISVKVGVNIGVHMPYTFGSFTPSEEPTEFTVRFSWQGAYLKMDLATGQVSGDFGSMEGACARYRRCCSRAAGSVTRADCLMHSTLTHTCTDSTHSRRYRRFLRGRGRRARRAVLLCHFQGRGGHLRGHAVLRR